MNEASLPLGAVGAKTLVAGRGRKVTLIAGGSLLGVILLGVALRPRGDKKLVEVEKLGRRTLIQRVTASGKVQAQRKADLSATVMGQIVNIAVKEGDAVKKGQVLLQIDRARAAAEAGQSRSQIAVALADEAQAQATLEQSRLDLKRGEEQFAKHLVSDAEIQKMRTAARAAEAARTAAAARVLQARAGLDASSDSLNKTTLRAPMDGVITRKAVEEGEMAVVGTMNNPGTVLLTVSDMSAVEAELECSEADVPQVKVAQPAVISIDAFPGRSFSGVVTEVGASPWIKTDGGASTGNIFKVKVQIKDPPANIRPGFTVTADIEVARRDDALALPLQAIVEKPQAGPGAGPAGKRGSAPGDGPAAKEAAVTRAADKVVDQLGVYLIRNGKSEFAPVRTGVNGDLYVEALEGPAEGTEVITGPFRVLRELKPGDAVQVKKQPRGDAKGKAG